MKLNKRIHFASQFIFAAVREIFLIRHGETDYNNRGIVQGKGVNPPLNEKGRWQAQQFFNRFRNENFDIVFTSTLKRAIETVKGFIDLKIPHKEFMELDEIGWGKFEGREVDSLFRHEFKRIVNEWQNGNYNICTEGGETPYELMQKHLRFIEMLRTRTEKKILVCMHGWALRIMLCTMLNKPLSEMDNFPHHNLSLYRVNDNGKYFELTHFNDLQHLHAEV